MPAGVEVVMVSHCGNCGRGLMEMKQFQLVQPEVVGMVEDKARRVRRVMNDSYREFRGSRRGI